MRWPFPGPSPTWLWNEGFGWIRADRAYGYGEQVDAHTTLVFLTVSGAGRFRWRGRETRVGAGDLSLVAGVDRGIRWSTDADHWEFYWLHLTGAGGEALAAQAGQRPPLLRAPVAAATRRLLRSGFERLLRLDPRRSADAALAQRLGLPLYLRVLETCGTAAAPARPVLVRGQPLLAAIDDYLARPDPAGDRVGEIARRLRITPEHLARLVRAATGRTVKALLRERRLEHACRLLRTSELPVAEVGAMVGYADPYHFSRVFAAYAGVPATRYRRAAARPVAPAPAPHR
ncbi:MAG TPA: AraC family transcriptional regulator [Planctomycetota bacterium]|nr:AraC family transcriptional regulator [Planctomycetota bacterium]